ncbi:MAG: helicase [Variovorax sp.]|nr:helicase [Variovorax sp.]
MNSSKIIAAAALTLLAAAGAQAETYEGVHALTHGANRTQVQAQAVVAAHSENPYAEGADSGVLTIASSADRATVRAQAVAAAHSPNPYADGYGQGVLTLAGSTLDRATVRIQARAAARGFNAAAL